ncbi:TraR/DksA family transcriptional regulator [Stieleria varia]|uniref:General stress protein 16O n=1 Tax=Stieleria varia TaxID=2528005 RepID=A0A5C6AJ26_9BACT|nr:TraR/DksA family transcriptional regulator [Stieleria varia]TWT98243.1 General stress protein 16O [Stieleria varia]
MTRKQAIEKLKATLIQRREGLRRTVAGDLKLLQKMHRPKSGDILDAVADSVQDELNSQLLEAESKELQAIDDAIARMDNDSYGICEGCGKSIPLTRLRAVPHANDCIECRRLLERKRKHPAASMNRVFDQYEPDPV